MTTKSRARCGCPVNAPEADAAMYACPCGDHCTDRECIAENKRRQKKRGHSTKGRSFAPGQRLQRLKEMINSPTKWGDWTVIDSDAHRMERATGRTSEPFYLNPVYYGVRIVSAARAGYTGKSHLDKYVVQYKDKNGMWFDIGDPKTKTEAEARKKSAAKLVVRLP